MNKINEIDTIKKRKNQFLDNINEGKIKNIKLNKSVAKNSKR